MGLFQKDFLPIDINQEKSTKNEGQTVRFALFSIVRMQLYAKFVVIRGHSCSKIKIFVVEIKIKREKSAFLTHFLHF